MNRIQYIAIAAACVCLSACGGGSKPTPAPDLIATSPKSSAQIVAPASEASVPVVPTEPDPTTSAPVAASAPAASEPTASAPAPASTPVVKIAIYGDDQIEDVAFNAMGMLTVVAPNEPAQLQALLQAKFNDSGISVLNLSSGGTASSMPNELDGMDGLGSPEPQRMAQSGATIVIQEHAINDNLGGETADQYAAYLDQWIRDAQDAGLQPVLEEPGPVCDGNHPRLPAYVAAMDEEAAKYSIPLIQQYTAISDIDGWQDHMVACLVPDSTLDTFRASQEQAVIAPLIAKLIKG